MDSINAGTLVEGVFRVDRGGELKAPVTTDEGYLKTEGYTARPGVMIYHEDGKEVRELVPRSTLHDRASLDTLAMKPVTLNHPSAMLTPETVTDYSRGTTGERADVASDGRVKFSLMVTDEGALNEIAEWKADGKVLGLSPGYRCDVKMTPGTDPEFGRYDRIQVNRRYNHLALTPTPRGGDGVHFRMDGVPALDRIDTQEPEVDLIDLLIKETGLSREDAQKLLDEGKTLIEKAGKFDALPEPVEVDEDAEKTARVEARKERRRIDAMAAELKLENSDDLDLPELKRAILTAAKVDVPKRDNIEDSILVDIAFVTYEALKPEVRKDEDDGGISVRMDASTDEPDDMAAFGAYGNKSNDEN
jgi:hypothetical protein